jgi:hypothetical protein
MIQETLLSYSPNIVPGVFLYLDPGTGSLLFSLIMGAATTAYFTGRLFYYKVLGRFFSKDKDASLRVDKFYPVIFYSEGKQYISTFQPLLKECANRGIKVLYLSSDKTDPALQFESEMTDTLFIGDSYAAWDMLSHIHANTCVMTTPGLDVLQIKRSPKVKHYMHVVHSPTDKAFNKPFSFDYYDSVVTNGPHQKKTIQYLEQLRNSRPKEFYECGCIYYDYLQEKLTQTTELNIEQRELHILVAPTWGSNGLLKRYGKSLLKPLIDSGRNIVIRPHPQSYISEAELITELKVELSSYTNIRWDESNDPFDAMMHSALMISDISGVIFDYAFLLEKPVLTVPFTPEKRGTEAMDIPYDPWELSVLDDIGERITEENFATIEMIIQRQLASSTKIDSIRDLRKAYVVNFGLATNSIVDIIAEKAIST